MRFIVIGIFNVLSVFSLLNGALFVTDVDRQQKRAGVSPDHGLLPKSSSPKSEVQESSTFQTAHGARGTGEDQPTIDQLLSFQDVDVFSRPTHPENC